MESESGVRGGAAGFGLLGAVVGGLEALAIHLGSEGPALHVFPVAVGLDAVVGVALGALIGLGVPALARVPARACTTGTLATLLLTVGVGLGPWAAPPTADYPDLPKLAPRSRVASVLVIAVDGLDAEAVDGLDALQRRADRSVRLDSVLAWSDEPRAAMQVLLSGNYPDGLAEDPATWPTPAAVMARERIATLGVLHGDGDLAASFHHREVLDGQHALGIGRHVRSLAWMQLLTLVLHPDGVPASPASEVVARARPFLASQEGERWFLVVHLRDLVSGEGLGAVDAAVEELLATAEGQTTDLVWAVVGAVPPDMTPDGSTQSAVIGARGGALGGETRWQVLHAVDVLPSVVADAGASRDDGIWDGSVLLRAMQERAERPRPPFRDTWSAAALETGDRTLPPKDIECDSLYRVDAGPLWLQRVDDKRMFARNVGYGLRYQGGKLLALYDLTADPGGERDLLLDDPPLCTGTMAAETARRIRERADAVLQASRERRGRVLEDTPAPLAPSKMPVPPGLEN